ncbi:synaptic vesicle 2-related protein-like isoform X2 [Aricia agestis]|nr:synaptic vesicle 2-related protein-like isoform X2 [Aricia agestis]
MDLFGFSLVVVAACDLHVTTSQKGILTSLPFIGILIVSYPWGYISDTKGRKSSLIVSVLAGFALSSLASLSPNWIVLGLIKFLSVCFSCSANSATYTLVGESCIQSVRSKYMLLMTCLIILSPAAASVVAYPTLLLNFEYYMPALGITFKAWRLLLIVLSIPSLLGGIAICFCHESPKFLANVGKNEEALEVLKSIYATNNGCSKEELGVTSLVLEDATVHKKMSIMRTMYEQSAPMFRKPLLWKTVQLYFIVSVIYVTNNTFLIWLPQILNLVRLELEREPTSEGNVCTLIAYTNSPVNATAGNVTVAEICKGTVEDNVIITLVISQCTYSFLNFVLSYLMRWRRIVLLIILCLSSLSGLLLGLVPNPVTSVVLFVVFTCTCLAMGIMASYFVELYPTSCRGMVACLSIMVGRTSTFVGINVAGNLIFTHCQATLSVWALLVLGSAVAAWFLPTDRPKV